MGVDACSHFRSTLCCKPLCVSSPTRGYDDPAAEFGCAQCCAPLLPKDLGRNAIFLAISQFGSKRVQNISGQRTAGRKRRVAQKPTWTADAFLSARRALPRSETLTLGSFSPFPQRTPPSAELFSLLPPPPSSPPSARHRALLSSRRRRALILPAPHTARHRALLLPAPHTARRRAHSRQCRPQISSLPH